MTLDFPNEIAVLGLDREGAVRNGVGQAPRFGSGANLGGIDRDADCIGANAQERFHLHPQPREHILRTGHPPAVDKDRGQRVEAVAVEKN